MGAVERTYDVTRGDASPRADARSAARPRRGAHAAPRASGWTPSRIAAAVLAGVMFLAGLAAVLYPTVSSWVNDQTQSRAVVDYDGAVEGLDPTQVEAIFAEAEAYNERLASLAVPLVEYEQAQGYEQTLDITGTGIMGYVEIPKIDVRLPIYHGTSNDVLVQATGHFEGTTLPIGGSGRHAVIAGHRGLPSALLFTYLDKLVVGDRFTVTVLDRVMTYEVDQIKEADPSQLEELAIVPGRDYVTLLTCTPYGINTERLLVRGVRVA